MDSKSNKNPVKTFYFTHHLNIGFKDSVQRDQRMPH